VTRVRERRLSLASMPRMSGATLMASGRVPKTVRTVGVTGELLIGRIGLSPRRARFSHLILALAPMVSLLIHCSCGVGRVVTRVTSEVVQPEFGAPRTCR